MKKIFWILPVASALLTAGEITITWDVPSDSSITGYKIYYGLVGESRTNVWLAGTNGITTISNLISAPDKSYRFVCVSTNSNGDESTFSNELITIIRPKSVQNVRLLAATSDAVIVEWDSPNDPEIVGYKVIYTVEGSDTVRTVETPVNQTRAVLTEGLISGASFSVDVVGKNAAGVESIPYRRIVGKVLPKNPLNVRVQVEVN